MFRVDFGSGSDSEPCLGPILDQRSDSEPCLGSISDLASDSEPCLGSISDQGRILKRV